MTSRNSKKKTAPSDSDPIDPYRLVALVEEYRKASPGELLMKWPTPRKSFHSCHHAE
ncbi:hypothetical protein SAMN05444156_2310 [Verrucomicrobium sp. GAS474]|uniref:hypothetical protein n=1 Tax=Verrucomicrobium sp. GAS474 TaxID=1882831 RepID=UPI0008792937|nr:hypothetical protein [Verrucomicrobium sp. GAS474]SDU15803.1 hypothetical protein SAMN05444156_2310 [Verrucomicrobium sp. GAS474]